MRTKQLIFAFLFMILAVPVLAQDGGGVDYPDYNSGGGGSGGNGFCYACVVSDTYAVCLDLTIYGWSYPSAGFSSCTAYHLSPPQQGPAYCQMSSPCIGGLMANRFRSAAEDYKYQADAIAAFLRDSHVVSGESLDAFESSIPYGGKPEDAEKSRLTAYRAKFAAVIGRELKPGTIPVMPQSRIKAPQSTIL